jgi:hypothetical protein
MTDPFNGLNYIIQYRRKDQTDSFDPWHAMVAFDALGPAQMYFEEQGSDTWEYQMIDLETGAIIVCKQPEKE